MQFVIGIEAQCQLSAPQLERLFELHLPNLGEFEIIELEANTIPRRSCLSEFLDLRMAHAALLRANYHAKFGIVLTTHYYYVDSRRHTPVDIAAIAEYCPPKIKKHPYKILNPAHSKAMLPSSGQSCSESIDTITNQVLIDLLHVY